jgi:TonB-dependent SusC/RagA subfamily outer membrane receptor
MMLLLFAGLQLAFAQRTITGTITTANDRKPLSGVSVQLKGTSVTALSDSEGNYSIDIPGEDSVLLFSIIGFNAQDIMVRGRSTLNVSLAKSEQTMSNLIVTALGIKRESRTLGYAIKAVNTDDLLTSRSINMMESLEGKVSGLNITIPAAGVGSSSQIRLRGQAGFAGVNNAPLFVINGLPLDQDAHGANGDNMRDLGDNLNGINPEDIESMTVLKGASAAAIYGSRAANGAIIITTKSGNRNKGIGLEFSSSYTVQKPLNYWDLQQVYGQGRNGQKPVSQADAVNYGQFGWGAKMDGSSVPIFDGTMRPYSPNPNNLFDYYRTGQILTNAIAFSGGDERGSFRASFSNTDADGIDPFNEYKKYIANLGVSYNVSKRIVFTMYVNYANEKYINPPELGQQGPGAVNFFTRLASSIPFDALKNSATNPATGTEALTSGFQGIILNPIYAYRNAGQRFENIRDRYLGTATLRYDITDWLYAQGRFNYNYSLLFTESKVPGGIGTSVPTNSDGTYKGSYNLGESRSTNINSDFLIGASKKFNKFSIDASFGGNTFRVKNHNFNESASNLTVRDFYSISNGVNKTQNYGFSQTQVNSLYGLTEFGYASMLYLNFTGRTDWFSVLNPAYNSKFYPSVSGSFVVSELLKDIKWLSYAKLRGSWAKVGTSPGQIIIDLPGTKIGTGTVIENEIGLEANLFNNKLHFDVSAFYKVSTDQELIYAVSPSSGYTSSALKGSLKNSGVEFMLEYTPFVTSDFRWTTSWNNSFLKTEVLSVGENADGTPVKDYLVLDFNSTGNEFLGELHYTLGMAMNQLYTKTYLRDASGNILLQNNGRLLGTTDYVPVGSSIPKHTGGWTNTFTYKNLTLGVFLDYKFGGTVLSATYLNMTRQGFSKLSLKGRRDGENGLVFPGVYSSTGLPNTTSVTDLQSFYGDYRNLQIGDPFTFKSDFLKLRYISVSYNLTNAINRLDFMGFIKRLTLTGTVRNVAILYKDIPNLDPEAMQSSGDFRAGYENAALPTTRNFMFTLNAKF